MRDGVGDDDLGGLDSVCECWALFRALIRVAITGFPFPIVLILTDFLLLFPNDHEINWIFSEQLA